MRFTSLAVVVLGLIVLPPVAPAHAEDCHTFLWRPTIASLREEINCRERQAGLPLTGVVVPTSPPPSRSYTDNSVNVGGDFKLVINRRPALLLPPVPVLDYVIAAPPGCTWKTVRLPEYTRDAYGNQLDTGRYYWTYERLCPP